MKCKNCGFEFDGGAIANVYRIGFADSASHYMNYNDESNSYQIFIMELRLKMDNFDIASNVFAKAGTRSFVQALNQGIKSDAQSEKVPKNTVRLSRTLLVVLITCETFNLLFVAAAVVGKSAFGIIWTSAASLFIMCAIFACLSWRIVYTSVSFTRRSIFRRSEKFYYSDIIGINSKGGNIRIYTEKKTVKIDSFTAGVNPFLKSIAEYYNDQK